MPPPSARRGRGPILICYDGSDFARRAVEESGVILGGGPAVVLTVFESIGSALLRHPPSDRTEIGRQLKEMSEDVVNELDSAASARAQATAEEGAASAAAAGFDPQPLARRALARATERDTATIWRSLL